MPSSHSQKRRSRRLRRVLLPVGLLGAVLGTLYALTPWLAAGLAPRLAGPLGVDELRVAVGRPGLHGLTLHSLDLVAGRVRIRAAAGRLDYRLGGLLAGRLEDLRLAQLTVTVDATDAARPGAPDGDPAAGRLPAPDPAALFAALPLRAASVEVLELAVPALEFAAAGSLRLNETALALTLRGRAPERAAGFALEARLARDGRLALRLAEADSPAAPFLALTSTVQGQRLALHGEANLNDFVLDLALALTGLPPGAGALTGHFDGSLPWPLPTAPDWAAPTAEGELTVDWRPADGDWRIEGAGLQWRIEDGAITAAAQAPLRYRGRSLQLAATVRQLVPAQPAGAGDLRLVDADPAVPGDVTLDWALTPDELSLDAGLDLQGALLELLRAELALPAGSGAVQLAGSIRLPWPLPAWSALMPRAEGTLGGHWRTADDAIEVTDLQGSWRLDGRQLAGQWQARLGRDGLRTDVGLTLARLELRERVLAATGSVRLGDRAPLTFSATQGLDGDAGTLALEGRLTASGGLAGSLLAGWSRPYDVTAGSVQVDAQLRWPEPGTLEGVVRLGLDGIEAFYDDYRLSGLSADLALTGEAGAWSLAPAPVRVARVATGVPLEDVTIGVAWSGDTVRVQAGTARLLGGQARIEPFEYAMAAGAGRLVVALSDLSLAQVLALEGEQVSGTGTLHGTIPVQLEGGAASVVDGRIRAEPPGGVIRVSPALAGGTGQPGLDFALRALQNFSYDVLEADVAYTTAGDLTLAVHLQGRNPDIERGRPIHYNLTVNENLPVLLESLRLERRLTEGIERRLNN